MPRQAAIDVTRGLPAHAAGMAAALVSADELTATVGPRPVACGTDLGFDLVPGNPRLPCHLGQARRQSVQFKAEVLKLMKVHE